MKKENEKKTDVLTKIVCEKCGKDDFIPFVSDGSRKYYCNDCLKEFNFSKKQGIVKKVFDSKKRKYVYEFVCSKCLKFFTVPYRPKEEEHNYFCLDCYDVIKQARMKKNRKKIVIAK